MAYSLVLKYYLDYQNIFLIDYLKINTGHEHLYKLTQEIIGNDQKISAAPFIWLKNNLYTSILLTIDEIDNWENFHKVYLVRNYTLALIILLGPLIFIFSQLNFQNKSMQRNKILISLTPCLCLFFFRNRLGSLVSYNFYDSNNVFFSV